MNWITLCKSNVHFVDSQVDKVIALHRQMQDSAIQGDIISAQKLADLETSIKRRIFQINSFYNQNGLDQRVRFLQITLMKLTRLINSSIISSKDEDLRINLSSKKKNNNNSTFSKISNVNKSTKKSITPQKNETLKDESNKYFVPNQVSKSPISRLKFQNTKNPGKANITLQIPNQIQHVTFSGIKAKTQYNQPKTSRKTQIIPAKNSSYKKSPNLPNTTQGNIKKQQIQNYQIKVTQPIQILTQSQISSSKSKLTNLPARNRTLAQNNNTSSIKKLNDLIFTIKMTKQQYKGFMDIKKNLEQQGKQG